MPLVAILCGGLLVAIGLDGYLDLFGLIRPSMVHSPTALIPVGAGALLILCGLVALKPNLRKHAMHFAAMMGLIGLAAGAWRGLPNLPKLVAGEAQSDGFKPAAVRLQLWMAGVCLVFVVLCVNSFIQARRRRTVQRGPEASGWG